MCEGAKLPKTGFDLGIGQSSQPARPELAYVKGCHNRSENDSFAQCGLIAGLPGRQISDKSAGE
jgi:hypothetical protein